MRDRYVLRTGIGMRGPAASVAPAASRMSGAKRLDRAMSSTKQTATYHAGEICSGATSSAGPTAMPQQKGVEAGQSRLRVVDLGMGDAQLREHIDAMLPAGRLGEGELLPPLGFRHGGCRQSVRGTGDVERRRGGRQARGVRSGGCWSTARVVGP